MFPKLFEIPSVFGLPSFPVHFYGLFLAIAFFSAITLAARRAETYGVSGDRMWDLSIWVLVSAIVGSKLLLVVVDPNHTISLRTAGVFYGGFIAASITAFWYIRKHELPFGQVADIVAPSIALGQGIGRLGCLSAGCCWGKPTDSILGVTFTSDYAHSVVGVPLHVPLWPTQLISSANGFLLTAILLFIASRRKFTGQVFWSYVLLYSVTRGLIEFLRGDPRGHLGPLSTSQVIAILAGMTAITALIVLGRKAAMKPAATPVVPASQRRKR